MKLKRNLNKDQILEELHQDTVDIVSDEIESERELWKLFGKKDITPVAMVEAGDESKLTPKFEFL